jgi:hypothetical protein
MKYYGEEIVNEIPFISCLEIDIINYHAGWRGERTVSYKLYFLRDP